MDGLPDDDDDEEHARSTRVAASSVMTNFMAPDASTDPESPKLRRSEIAGDTDCGRIAARFRAAQRR
jgi:hypothetical protein